MSDQTKSPRPTADDVLRGWKIVTSGKVQLQDLYWQYQRRVWLPVKDKHSFLGDSVRTSMGVFIRRVEKTKND
jgi:hypothetical protein